MATPSSKYNVINTVTIGSGTNAVQRDVTDTYKNIYPRSNEPFDKSIWYTKTKCKDIFHAGVPTIGGNTHVEYLTDDGTDESYEWWNSATGSGKMRVYDLKFSPYQETDAEIGYTLGYYSGGVNSNYWWGTNASQENVIGNITAAIVRNWKYNENVLTVANITVYDKSNFETFLERYDPTIPVTNWPTTKNISLAELIANPDDYLVRSFRLGGSYLWNATQNKYVASMQQFPVLNIDLKANGIGATGVNALYEQFFVGQGLKYRAWSPYQILCSALNTATYKPNGNRPISTNIPLGLVNDTNFYHYSLGMKSADYKVIIDRQIINDVLDSIVIPSGQTQATISDTYVSFNKLTDDVNHVVYSAGMIAGGKNETRTWLTSYNWTPVILYKGSFIIKVLASFGMYISADASDMATATPETLNNTPNVYLGEMDSSGLTTGRLIPWTDLDKYEGYNKGGTDINPDFDPDKKGGGGDTESDPNPMIDLYSVVAGSIDIYAMTAGQVNDMFNRLNSIAVPADFDPNPTMISLKYYPFDLKDFVLAGNKNITWLFREGSEGQYSRQVFPKVTDDPLPAGSVVRQMRVISLGEFYVDEKQIAEDVPFLNHDCVCSIYIPFCGTVDLNIEAVLGRTLSVKLAVDVVCGDCMAYIYADNNFIANASGICSCEIPISTGSYGSVKSNVIAGTVKSIFAAGTGAAYFGVPGANLGNIISGVNSVWESGTRAVRTFNARNAALSGPVSGSTGSLASFTGPMNCIFNISKPVPVITDKYGHVNGYPEVSTKTIGECSGYVVCYNADCSSIPCTDDERKLIEEKLRTGIFVSK